MTKHEDGAEDVRQLPTMNLRFAPICIDPSQISILTAGQTEPETLDTYIRRMAREESAVVRVRRLWGRASGRASP